MSAVSPPIDGLILAGRRLPIGNVCGAPLRSRRLCHGNANEHALRAKLAKCERAALGQPSSSCDSTRAPSRIARSP